MSIEHQIKLHIKEALKSKNQTVKDILTVIVGEVERAYPEKTDYENSNNWIIVINKMLKSNNEMLSNIGDSRQELKKQLLIEKAILEQYLPKTISVEEIKTLLVDNKVEINQTIGEGRSIGNAMKYLKTNNIDFKNSDVKVAVVEILAN